MEERIKELMLLKKEISTMIDNMISDEKSGYFFIGVLSAAAGTFGRLRRKAGYPKAYGRCRAVSPSGSRAGRP